MRCKRTECESCGGWNSYSLDRLRERVRQNYWYWFPKKGFRSRGFGPYPLKNKGKLTMLISSERRSKIVPF